MSRVGPAAFALGFAGLLPQGAAALSVVVGDEYRVGAFFAFGYGALILSFLGGMWWGFAMRRDDGQGRLATVAVVPSLAALAIGIFTSVRGTHPLGLVLLGSAMLLTLLVDRHLVRTGEAPANWMRLRVPLSVGLGLLTIGIGILSAQPLTP